MDISIGRTVFYILTADDAKQINRRRTTGSGIAERIKKEIATLDNDTVPVWPLGAQAHIGNDAHEGDVFPMVATRLWSAGCVNGQVLLDGNDVLWVTSRTEGTQPGTWQWPPRA